MSSASDAASPFLVLAIGVPAFQAAMPSPQDARMADGTNPKNRAVLRSGEITGTAILLAVGVAVSFLDKNPQAIYLAAITAALLIMVQELLLRRPGFHMEGPA